MSNYVKSTDFASKDALASGNAAKIVKGTEIDTEFNNIAIAVATKADTVSPTFTGTPSLPTGATAVTQSTADSSTKLATTAFVAAVYNALGTMSTQNANAVAITGGTITSSTITSSTITNGTISGGTITGLASALPIASGGTGLTAVGTNTQILASNGTAALWQNPTFIGVGQTWQTPVRVAGTTYTNTTGKPIMVSVIAAIDNTGTYLQNTLTVDGIIISKNWANGINPASVFTTQGIVPNGSSYSVTVNSNGTIGLNWLELR